MLHPGATGASVCELQARLDGLGEALVVDGIFGPLTRAAVVRFQRARGLDPDGVVGPLTWGALDATTAGTTGPDPGGEGPLLHKPGASSDGPPALDDLGGEGDQVAIGDAEGNSTGPDHGPLETLDRDGDTTASDGLAAGNALGFGDKPAAPSRPPPVEHAGKAALLAGGFADRGTYRETGDGFVDADLDDLLATYGTFWGVDVRATPRPDDATVTAPGAGDSAGKGVATHPPWVKALENKIIGRGKWDDDDRATQRLIEAYLRRYARDVGGELPPGAEQLFHQVGASETNGQAGSLGGQKGASNWCAPASHIALLVGMYNRGIRFKTETHSNRYGVELQKQIARYAAWTKRAGHVVSGAAAHTATLEPGDIISVVNGGASGPLSGHVATVVKHDGDRIVYVSGNAAGVVAFDGAVRIEEVKREQPPAGYDWSKIAAREKAFQGATQTDKQETAAADADREAAFAHLNAVLAGLSGPTLPPPVDLRDPMSIAGLMVWLFQLPDGPDKQAALAHAAAIMRLGSSASSHEAAAAAAKASRAAMLDDGGLPVNREDKRFVPDVHAPRTPGASWVVEVIKASALTAAQVMADGSLAVEPTDPMLEKGPVLAEQCPDAPPEVVNRSAR